MSMQQRRTMQELRTPLGPAEVLDRAKRFFMQQLNIYSTFLDREGPTFVSFRGQGGEEIAIGVAPSPEGGTLVTGSTYLFDMQIARFFSTLPATQSEPASAAALTAPADEEAAS
jgi:hypothetical protein